MKKLILLLLPVVAIFWLLSCGGEEKPKPQLTSSAKAENADPMLNKGIGPIKEVTLDPEINQEMVAKGAEIYEKMCTACHKPDSKFIGPAQKGVLERRSPEWVMNMILNPEEMVKSDPIAKKLLMEYNGAPMANQQLTEEEARAILEYFRTL